MQRVLPTTRELPLFDASQTRAIEGRAAASMPTHALMQRAGESTAKLALAIAPHADRIWIAAGPGNNGGDGLEAAIHLMHWGKDVEVAMVGDSANLPADAARSFARAQAAGLNIAFDAIAPSRPPQFAVDALLGVGVSRPPQGPIAECIRRLNALTCPVLAVDLPSGLHGVTGQPLGNDCVVATHTLAMLTLKPGMFTGAGRDHAGDIWLDELGISTSADAPRAWLSGPSTDSPATRRTHAMHKGSFGDVAVIGGARGMSGAALLAARAAHAAGAGRVYVELLDDSAQAPFLDPARPELMFRKQWSRSAPDVLARSTAVCGCGGSDDVRALLPRLLSLAFRLVLDADALNTIAADAMLVSLLHARKAHGRATVLTPHPLEAARLLNCVTAQVQADRLHAALELADRYGCAVVLKGSGSVIAAPGEAARINGTGNAALATAGTGDVLAGWLGGRWAQHSSGDEAATAFKVACQAVAEHGAASEPQPSGPLRANDLIERLYGG